MRDRLSQEEANSAATALIGSTLAVVAEVKHVRFLSEAMGDGQRLENSHYERWEAAHRRFTDDFTAHGGLLPSNLETEVDDFVSSLDRIVDADWDEEGFPIHIDAFQTRT